MTTRNPIAAAALLLTTLLAAPALAAAPPDALNYQGVLRNAQDQPLSGSYSMVFHFYPSSSGGTELMRDEHLAAGSGAVPVTGGQFSATLCGGTVLDGPASGPSEPYTSCEKLFRDYGAVFMEIEVRNGATPELLAPRVRVVSAAYALSASHANSADDAGTVDGKDGGTLIDTSSTSQVKAGPLEIAGLLITKTDPGTPHLRRTSLDGLFGRFTAYSFITSLGSFTVTDSAASVDDKLFSAVRSGDFDFLKTEGTPNAPVRLQVRDTSAKLVSTIDGPAGNKRSLTLTTSLRRQMGYGSCSRGSTRQGMQFHGPNNFEFYDSVVSSNPAVATLGASTGNLMIKGDLLVTGANIDGGTGASLQIFSDGNFRPRSNSGIKQMIDFDNTSGSLQFEWFANGAEAAANKLADLSETGNLRIHGTLSQNVAFDLAETFLATGPVEPGDLVAVDPARPNAILRTHGAGDPLVLGVVSARPGVVLGSAPFDVDALGRTWGEAAQQAFLAQREALAAEVVAADPSLASAAEFGGPEETARRIEELALERFHARATAPVALAGRVPVKVDARYGAIAAGDPLTPSPLPGIAMKAVAPSPIIGTALQPLASGSGRILAFVHRGWYGGNGATSAAGEAPLAPRSADAAGTSAAPLAVQVAFATPPPAAAPSAARSAGRRRRRPAQRRDRRRRDGRGRGRRRQRRLPPRLDRPRPRRGRPRRAGRRRGRARHRVERPRAARAGRVDRDLQGGRLVRADPRQRPARRLADAGRRDGRPGRGRPRHDPRQGDRPARRRARHDPRAGDDAVAGGERRSSRGYSRASTALITVSTTLARAQSLSSASTTVHGACVVLVWRSMSVTAAR